MAPLYGWGSTASRLVPLRGGSCKVTEKLVSSLSRAKLYPSQVVKALESQSRGPLFKTTGWLQGQLSLSSFRGW